MDPIDPSASTHPGDPMPFVDSKGDEHPMAAIATATVRRIDGGQDAADGQATVILAIKDKPWPEPPSAGTWSRNAETGDLTLLAASGTRPTPEERAARREKQRADALRLEAQKTNSKE